MLNLGVPRSLPSLNSLGKWGTAALAAGVGALMTQAIGSLISLSVSSGAFSSPLFTTAMAAVSIGLMRNIYQNGRTLIANESLEHRRVTHFNQLAGNSSPSLFSNLRIQRLLGHVVFPLAIAPTLLLCLSGGALALVAKDDKTLYGIFQKAMGQRALSFGTLQAAGLAFDIKALQLASSFGRKTGYGKVLLPVALFLGMHVSGYLTGSPVFTRAVAGEATHHFFMEDAI